MIAQIDKTILNAPEAYETLALMPDAVGPFCGVLRDMGYEDSCKRVTPAGDI